MDTWFVRCRRCGAESVVPTHVRRCPGCDCMSLEEVEEVDE